VHIVRGAAQVQVPLAGLQVVPLAQTTWSCQALFVHSWGVLGAAGLQRREVETHSPEHPAVVVHANWQVWAAGSVHAPAAQVPGAW
jgi:hypothetical protein